MYTPIFLHRNELRVPFSAQCQPLSLYSHPTSSRKQSRSKNPPARKFPNHISVSGQWVAHDPPGPDIKPSVLPEVPRTPNVPDYDPIPPEKPTGPNLEFLGPPPELLSHPDQAPPLRSPPHGPEIIPPKPPKVGPPHPLDPDIPPPVSDYWIINVSDK